MANMATLRLQLLTFLLFYCTLQVNGDCKNVYTLLSCLHSQPSATQIKNARDANSVIISSYSGSLNLQPIRDTEGLSFTSIQVQKSVIDHIDPGYLSKQFGSGIDNIRFNGNNGTLNLDQNTLGGLEDTLRTLSVTEFRVGTTNYLHRMRKLQILVLARVDLKTLPPSFPQMMEHLTKVDLSQNQLTTLPWDVVAKQVQRKEFDYFNLGGNNWTCDCTMKPIVQSSLEVKFKLGNFYCWQPPELHTLPLSSLKVEDICTGGKEEYVQPSVIQPSLTGENANVDGDLSVMGTPIDDPNQLDAVYKPHVEEEPQVATAGGVSTEVIAVIVAVVFVVILVVIAVVVFKVRSRKQQQQQRQSAQKQPSHKSNAYCHVIEHPSSKNNPSSRTGGSATYGRDLDTSESQPLAPSYYGNKDNRL